MTRHNDTTALHHMLDHAAEAMAIARRRMRSDLGRDRQFSLALLKLVEIVGEAAKRVSTPTRDAHPEIPWDKIVGTRNRLVHGYDSIDYAVLWDIVTLDLPPLVAALEGILGPEGQDVP